MFVTVAFPVTNRRIARNAFSIKVPSGHIMTTTHEADIICDALRPAARKAHIVPGLDHDCSLLLSIGTLCDADYNVTFHKKHMKVYDTIDGKDTLVLIGHQNPANGLWHVDLVHPTIHMENSIGDPTTSALVAFAHSSLFSPVLSTLETALEIGYVTNFPGLTAKTLHKHPPKSIAMTKGHQD
jgi:hypothetical protein